MRITRQVITILVLGAPASAIAEETEATAHPPTIIERPPVLPLGGWRTTIEVSAVGAGEEKTGGVGISTGLFPGFEAGLKVITEFGNRERETGAKVRARLVRSLLGGPRLAVIAALHGEYDYDVRRWMDVGFAAQAQVRLSSLLLFAGGDDVGGDFDQSSARLSLPVGVGFQFTSRLYGEAVAMLEASYDSMNGSTSSAAPLAASVQISLTEALDVVLTANAREESGTSPGEMLWLLAARYQGEL
jgi:hypothetical protein